LKAHVEKMSTFRLAMMLMKPKELKHPFQDVDENKGESCWTRGSAKSAHRAIWSFGHRVISGQ
jgi:hypothetical protein